MGQIVKLPNKTSKGRSGQKKTKRNFIFRDRLISLADTHQTASMLLLYAPAGYGKTAFIQQYADEKKADGWNVGWLALDHLDRDKTHLSKRIAQYLSGVSSDMLLGRDGASLDTQVSEPECMLIFDNAERIRGSEGERLLLRLLEQKLPLLKLVVATRLRPEFGITKFQISGDLAVIDAQTLCFDARETERLLVEYELEIPTSDISTLHLLTEGWPAATRIACMALGQENIDLSLLVAGDVYAWRNLHNYFLEEILMHFSPEARKFLLDIAPLGRVTKKFAKKLSGMRNAAEYMLQLEENGLLALEDAGQLQQWYRFHPLLSKYLEEVLQKEDADRLAEIHRAAIEWNKNEGRLSDAIRHAFAAGETMVAAELLERASMERRRHGRPTPVADWSDQIPDEAYDKHPLLRMEAACSFATSFALEAARMHTNSVRKQFSDLDPIVRDDLFAADALIKIYGDQPEGLVDVAERGLRDCIARDPYTVGTLHLCATIGLIARSNLSKAKRAALEGKRENDRAENVFGMAVSHTLLGLVHAVEGDLTAAIDCWKQADIVIQPATNAGFVDKIAIGYMPGALYQRNQPEEARAYLERCLDGPIEIMLPDMVTDVYLTASRLAVMDGNYEEALSVLDEAEATAVEKGWPRLSHAVDWERIRVSLQRKNYDEARRLVSSIKEKQEFTEISGILTYALEAEANLIGELRFESLVAPNPAVISRLKAATSRALSNNRKQRAVKLLIIEAICRKNLGDSDAALRAMLSALKHGAEGRLIRSFLDEGPVVLSLVREIAEKDSRQATGLPRDYLEDLLESAGGALPQLKEAPVITEALSDREMDVLKLLFDGCSNADAAERLFVSENTIKWHLQHIYSKLGVKNRTAAVAAARLLNLVD